jgi:transcription elongation factor GreA
VKIKNTVTGMEMVYKLVAQSEADLSKGLISVDSPIGRGLLGKKVSESTEVKVPNGIMNFEIIEITRG